MTSATDNKRIFSFIRDYLPRLPDDILIQIFNRLTSGYFIVFFFHFPNRIIRDLLIRHYYSKKVCFEFVNLSPSDEPFWGPYNKFDELVKFRSYQTKQGKSILTKVVPKKLVLIIDRDSSKVKNILKLKCTKSIPELEIIIRKGKRTRKDFYELISIPNLTKLHLIHIDLNCIAPRSIDDSLALRNHGKLTEIALLWYKGDTNWSEIEFPQRLSNLVLYNYLLTDIDTPTLIIPESIQRLKLIGFGIPFRVVRNIFPPHLTEISLRLRSLTTINVYELPIGLEILDLSGNELQSISGKKWPPNLHVIDLSFNSLKDDGFEAITDTLGWPEGLTSLDIIFNKISRNDHLELLPHSLQALNISNNPFIWLNDQVLEFPCNLKRLDMSRCELEDLQYIKFPSSLKELDLKSNMITNILSYSDWSKLANLRKLNVSFNSISSLDNWVIPPNVIELLLYGNPIESLTSRFPLFNPNYSSLIVELSLGECELTTWEIDYIPPSLKRLELWAIDFPGSFVFPSAFKRLNHLDLYGNSISTMVFDDNDDTKSCLHSLELCKNNILGENPSSESINEFYDVLEKNLGKVKQRYNDVNRLHVFERCHAQYIGSRYYDCVCIC